jgi:hypothetical protein
MSKIIIEMTPFLFEDGNTYYFEVTGRNSNNYHRLDVYERIVGKTFWGKEKISYKQIGDGELVETNMTTSDIKRQIYKILSANKVEYILKDWDGVVGNIPDDVKKALTRNSKLNDLLK